jgi:hypothetical protein
VKTWLRGRKKSGIKNPRFFVIRIDEDLARGLNRYCKVINLSKNEFARIALEKQLVFELKKLRADIRLAKSVQPVVEETETEIRLAHQKFKARLQIRESARRNGQKVKFRDLRNKTKWGSSGYGLEDSWLDKIYYKPTAEEIKEGDSADVWKLMKEKI